ncbi:unnamed protein product [Caenorhabditis bovis]|uniref:Serpentine Receptor, class H n=1 Tax=Caenorhabditis bovis TaxID=2654633 RepID=A0A8S1EAE3_9PELO|nr:unnamed protein product [Caenorhabditis bovis]
MQKIVKPLMELQIWNTVTDLAFGFLVTPIAFVPCNSGAVLGLLRLFQVPLWLQIFSGQIPLTNTAVAIILLFENRYSAIVQTKYKMTRPTTRLLYQALCYMYSCFVLLPLIFFDLDQEKAKLECLRVIPCPIELFFEPDHFVIPGGISLLLFIIIFTIFLFCNILFYAIRISYFLNYELQFLTMSLKTQKMQKSSFIAILLHTIFISILLGVPATYVVVVLIMQSYYNQALNNLAVLFVSLHGPFSTVFMIFANRPYREYTMRIWNTGKMTLGPKSDLNQDYSKHTTHVFQIVI